MRGERLQGWAIAVAAIVVLGAGGFALTSDWTGLAVFALAFASIQAVVFVGFFRAYGDALVARGRPRWHALIPVVGTLEIVFLPKAHVPRIHAFDWWPRRHFFVLAAIAVILAAKPTLLVLALPIVWVGVWMAWFRAVGDALEERGKPRWHAFLGDIALLEVAFNKKQQRGDLRSTQPARSRKARHVTTWYEGAPNVHPVPVDPKP